MGFNRSARKYRSGASRRRAQLQLISPNIETWPTISIGPCWIRAIERYGGVSLKYLRPILAIYGTGIATTFAWLFFALSGTAACALGAQSCRVVVGLTSQLALVWPAYWGGRISGGATMTPLVPFKVVAIAILVFVVVLLLAQAYKLIGRPNASPERNEPLIRTSEPNRRNQSRSSKWVRGARSTPP
jgi:hypothetical protein